MGRWFYLYLILDLYSRKIVGFEVHETDDSEHAVNLLRRARPSPRPPAAWWKELLDEWSAGLNLLYSGDINIASWTCPALVDG